MCCMVPPMKLSDWLTKTDTTYAAFAKQVGVTSEAVRLWCLGERMPRKAQVVKIAKATAGKVNIMDFWS